MKNTVAKIVLNYLILSSFCMIIAPLWGQPKSYRFKHFSTEQGLSHHQVTSTLEDKKGFIWIGTVNGVNRYDGYSFKTYYPSVTDSVTINSTRIRVLFEDSRSNLYIGTSNGLDRYDPLADCMVKVSLENHQDFSNSTINDIKEANDGKLWMATNQGIFVLNNDQTLFRHYTNDKKNKNSLPGNTIGRILFDNHNQVWIGGQKYISKLDPEKGVFSHFLIFEKFRIDRDPLVNVMIQDSKGRIWFGSNQAGLSLFNETKQQFEYYPLNSIVENDVLHNRVRAIKEDKSGNLWLGTFDGLIIFNPDSDYELKIESDPNDPYSLSDNGIISIYEDKRGNYWIGSFFGGVNYLDKNFNLFKHYQYTGNEKGLSYNVISFIAEDKAGKIWIATDRGGLNLLDPITQKFEYFTQKKAISGSASNHIMEIEVGEQDNLWLGTLYGGLFSFNMHTRKFTPVNFNNSEIFDLGVNRIRSLQSDSKGNLWIAHSAGLHYYNISTGKSLQYTTTLNDIDLSNTINMIFEDKQENIWLALDQEDGLIKLEHIGWEFEKYNIPKVQVIFQDEDYIWLGTDANGLFRLDPRTETIKKYSNPNLSKGSIIGILSDNQNNLWLSSSTGLYQFDKDDGNFKILQREHGLSNNDFRKNAYLKSKTGIFYFGGRNGMISFNPAEITKEIHTPSIEITSLTVVSNRKDAEVYKPSIAKIMEDGTLELPYHQNTLFIDFAALNYSQPEKTQYTYQLEGFDDWNYIGANRKATYTNLDPGIYTLHFKATNNDGIWASKSRPLIISILPPPWRTWWAYLIYALSIIGVSFVIKQIITNRIRLKNKLKLEHFKNEQEKEIHELKYRFFTNISHDLRTPLTLILGPLEKLLRSHKGDNMTRSLYNTAYKNAEHLLRLVNQLLDFRKLETNHIELRCAEGNIVLFIYEIFISFQELARLRNMEYLFICDEKDIRIWFDRDKVEKIFYNLLSNAFKFTPEKGKISIRITADESKSDDFPNGNIKITVEDTGMGISKNGVERIFHRYTQEVNANFKLEESSGIGLAIAKGYTELHKGKISVKSTLGEGTIFKVQFPSGSSHLSNSQIVENFKDSEAESHYHELSLENISSNLIITENNRGPRQLEKQPLLLIVEDNLDVQLYIAGIFNSSYRIITAGNGEEGWDQALKHNPDLIISDVMMPNMNGIELCSKLKRDINTSHIPIILLSARTSLIFKVNGLETGADDYVGKPFSQQVLQLKVQNLIESRRKLRERFVKEFNLSPKELAITTADERFLDQVIKCIERHMKNPDFGIEFIGKEVRMTRGHLYRKIKALTNMTATEFVRSIRLRSAATLLKTSNMNVNETCYEIGFQDPNYYRKCFKKMYGVSPSEYRNRPSDFPALFEN